MPGLADFFNAPTAVEFEGKTYSLRAPDQLEQGMFQRWLEQRAYDAIERRTYQDADQQAADRNLLNQDVAAGVYEWGSEVCVRALRTQTGLAKLIAIICREEGMTEAVARRYVERNMREIAAVLLSKVRTDPFEVAAALVGLGLPPDFLNNTSSSDSPTPPSGGPSPNSPDSATTSSSSTSTSSTTSPAPPG